MNLFAKIKASFTEPILIRSPLSRSFTIGNLIFNGQDRSESDTISHEQTHAQQQSGINSPFINPSWLLRYLLDDNFRWRKEKEAVTNQILFRQKNNMSTNYGALFQSLKNDYHKMASETEIFAYIQMLQSTDNISGSIKL